MLIAPSWGRAETWTPTTAGTRDRNDAANWEAVSFPNAAGGVANISADFTRDRIINLNEGVTLGTLIINDTGSGTGNAVTIQAANGSHSAPVLTLSFCWQRALPASPIAGSTLDRAQMLV